jgi:hypothetical protein
LLQITKLREPPLGVFWFKSYPSIVPCAVEVVGVLLIPSLIIEGSKPDVIPPTTSPISLALPKSFTESVIPFTASSTLKSTTK